MENENGKGILFINRQTNEKQPTHKGKITIKGEEIKLAGWLRKSANGVEYISLMVDTFVPTPKPENNETITDSNRDLPF